MRSCTYCRDYRKSKKSFQMKSLYFLHSTIHKKWKKIFHGDWQLFCKNANLKHAAKTWKKHLCESTFLVMYLAVALLVVKNEFIHSFLVIKLILLKAPFSKGGIRQNAQLFHHIENCIKAKTCTPLITLSIIKSGAWFNWIKKYFKHYVRA